MSRNGAIGGGATHVIDRRRHAPVGRGRFAPAGARAQGLPQVYRGRSLRNLRDIYDNDHAEARRDGRFRWLVSTCLAAAVGAVAIVVVIYGSLDPKESADGLIPTLQRVRESGLPSLTQAPKPSQGLAWASPRADKLQLSTGATATRFIIHETLRKRRNGRDYIENKPYARIVARLSPVPAEATEEIPAFNPFKLYANTAPVGEEEKGDGASGPRADVDLRVVELLGGILPGEDGQELDNDEVAEIVARVRESETEPALIRGAFRPEGSDLLRSEAAAGTTRSEPVPPNTTVLQKSVAETEFGNDLEGAEVRVVRVGAGETLTRVLMSAGAETQQAKAMVAAASGVFADSALAAGMEVRMTLVPSLTTQGEMEPARFSVFDAGHSHRLTVYRNEAGDLLASAQPVSGGDLNATIANASQPSTLYASLYHAARLQNLPADRILHILRVHAYETDFRRRLRPGDTAEFFFDLNNEAATDGPPGELLYSSISTGGERSRFYRFRTPDGIVDYYDEFGNNSKRFLMRRPVRGENVRLTSGFGMRRHPLLGTYRPHRGIDWAASRGTPILAAGNGIIEEARFRGEYGNHVRIRHANGYQTSYSHMHRINKGVVQGVKVRQGQIIGFVGSTGLSSGPHLHYEVLVNSQRVDPLKIQVPRERKLTGRELAAFQMERARIDDLLRRAPVKWSSR